MSAPVALIASFTHPALRRPGRRQPFGVNVVLAASTDAPPTFWRVREGACPACKRSHEVAVSYRRPRPDERLERYPDLATIAEPLPDPNAGYPHPTTRRLSLG